MNFKVEIDIYALIFRNKNNNNNNLFGIPEIHQSGYRTCYQITTGIIQNEKIAISYI